MNGYWLFSLNEINLARAELGRPSLSSEEALSLWEEQFDAQNS